MKLSSFFGENRDYFYQFSKVSLLTTAKEFYIINKWIGT